MAQLHVRLEADELKRLTDKLTEDHGHRPSRSAVIRSWVIAYLEGRLRIE
jgi:hypothetical protein